MRVAFLSTILIVISLSGCAVGQKVNYANTHINIRNIESIRQVTVAVLDQRAYILSGNKSPSFVGLSRGGFGNPFNVTTESKTPLASEMTTAIAMALKAKKLEVRTITVTPGDGAEGARQALFQTYSDRMLLFTLHEWKTDSMMRTGLVFDVALDVYHRDGQHLARSHVSGKEVSGASILSAEKDAQKWFADKVATLLGDAAVARELQ